MNAYVINLIILIIIYFLTSLIKDKENRRKIFLYLSFFQLFLFLALRNVDVGEDLKNYMRFFENCMKYDLQYIFTYRYEKGYILYNYIIAKLFNNSHTLLVVTAFISLLGPFYIIKKYSNNYFFSLFIYVTFQFYIFTFSGLRQAIAISILLLSIKFIIEKKLIKFILMVILATLFHKSAILFIFVYFISRIKIDNKKLIFIVLGAFFLMIFGGSILNTIFKYLYNSYELYSSDGGIIYLVILTLCLIIFTLIKQSMFNEQSNILWYNILIIAILLQILAIKVSVVSRLNMYYTISLIILLPNALQCFKDKKIRFISKLSVLVMLMFYFISDLNNPILYHQYTFF